MTLIEAIQDLERSLSGAVRELQAGLTEAHKQIEYLRSAKDNSVVYGKVTDVDAKKHRIRVAIGKDDDGEDVKSPWIPYSQISGTRKVHSVPSKGQQMTIMAPNGDLSQSLAFPLTWHNKNPSPSEKGDEDIDLRGKAKRTQKDGEIKQEVEGVTRSYTKQAKSTTIHKDPETQAEGKGETVDDENPWKGNRAKKLHVSSLNKDGGYSITINADDDEKEHKILVHPDGKIEHSVFKGKHKITVDKDKISHSFDNGKSKIELAADKILHSFDNGQHEVKLAADGISHKSSSRVTIQSPQIQHQGDMMLTGSLSVAKVIQSAGFIGNLQGSAGGIGFLGGLTPPTTW